MHVLLEHETRLKFPRVHLTRFKEFLYRSKYLIRSITVDEWENFEKFQSDFLIRYDTNVIDSRVSMIGHAFLTTNLLSLFLEETSCRNGFIVFPLLCGHRHGLFYEAWRFIGEKEPCGDTIKLNVRWLDPARLTACGNWSAWKHEAGSRCTAAHTDCVTLEK